MRKFLLFLLIFISACATTNVTKDDPANSQTGDNIEEVLEQNLEFLNAEPRNAEDVFRVVMMSDKYEIAQKKYSNNIYRVSDQSGDEYFRNEIAALNKINETRVGVVKVWLYPDKGNIMQIRFVKSTYLREVDKIILEDIQRWNFKFKKKAIYPLKFDVKYRVVLQKKISDDQILEEMRKKLEESGR